MKKVYVSPSFQAFALRSAEDLLTGSEEAVDINVSFFSLFRTGL